MLSMKVLFICSCLCWYVGYDWTKVFELQIVYRLLFTNFELGLRLVDVFLIYCSFMTNFLKNGCCRTECSLVTEKENRRSRMELVNQWELPLNAVSNIAVDSILQIWTLTRILWTGTHGWKSQLELLGGLSISIAKQILLLYSVTWNLQIYCWIMNSIPSSQILDSLNWDPLVTKLMFLRGSWEHMDIVHLSMQWVVNSL